MIIVAIAVMTVKIMIAAAIAGIADLLKIVVVMKILVMVRIAEMVTAVLKVSCLFSIILSLSATKYVGSFA